MENSENWEFVDFTGCTYHDKDIMLMLNEVQSLMKWLHKCC